MTEIMGGGSAIELWLAETDRREVQSELQRRTWAELEQEPMLERSALAVEMRDSVAVLRGCVESFAQKAAASRAASRVPGVQRIANEIVVEPPRWERRTDAELARMARRTLLWSAVVPVGAVRVRVANHCLRLEGQVDHEYERAAAERALEALVGLRDLVNAVTVRAAVEPPRAVAG